MNKKKTHNGNKAVQTTQNCLEYIRSSKKEIEDGVALDINQPNYTSIIKKMIKNTVHGRKTNDTNDFKCGSIYQKRRIDALTEYMPLLVKQLKNKYPDAFVEGLILDMTSSPTASLPDRNFIRNDKSFTRPITMGIALFILDDLLQNQTLWEALLYLPELDEIPDAMWDKNFNDATFPTEVIMCLAYLIEKRNDDNDDTFLTPASVKRTYETVNRLNFAPQYITAEMYNNCDETVVSIRKTALQMSYRDRIDKILSLMSQATIEQAEDHFRSQFVAFFDIALALTRDYDNQTIAALNDVEKNLLNMEALNENFIQTKAQTEAHIALQHQIDPKCSLIHNTAKFCENAIMSNFDTIAKYADDIQTRDVLWDGYCRNIEELQIKLDKLSADRRSIIYLIENGHNHGFTYDGKKEIIDKIGELGIDNPYETVFAYFWLLDRGDNIVWLVEPAAAVNNIAVGKLPWTAYNRTIMDKLAVPKNEQTETNVQTIHSLDTKMLAPLYDKTYNDYVYWYNDDSQNIDSNELTNISFAQMAYDLSNTVVNRQSNCYKNGINKALMRTGVKKRNVPIVQLMLETFLATSQRNKIKLFDDISNATTNGSKEKSAMKQALAEKSAEIDSLTSKLYEADKKARDEKARADKILEDARCEHDELIELRELVYKLQNDTSNENDTTGATHLVTLPYLSKQNIVAFGGHDTWLKVIKPLLPNVKFIQPNANPDIQLFRNADVIWMQSNAMPHAFYNKIMDIARTNKIPVKYFAYASAEKCAYQLAETDTKR